MAASTENSAGADQNPGVGGDAGASVGRGDASVATDTSSSAADTTSPALVDWNGEVTALRESDWFRALDQKHHEPVLKGIEAKYQNYEKRYKPEYEAQTKRRKELDERDRRVQEEERRVMRLWTGSDDPMEAKQAEIAALTQAHETRVQQIIEQHRAELEGAKKPGPELEAKLRRLDEMEAKLTEVTQARSTAETRLASIEKAETDAALDAFEVWLGKSAPHLIGDDVDSQGFDALIRLIDGGTEPERALKMVLAEYPSPTPQPEALSPGMRAMSRGQDARTERQEPVELHEAFERMRRQALPAWNGGR